MHLHTERKKTFQFLDLIHQTKCALNFNKLLNYKPQQHSYRGCYSSGSGSVCRIWFLSHSGTPMRSPPSSIACSIKMLKIKLKLPFFI